MKMNENEAELKELRPSEVSHVAPLIQELADYHNCISKDFADLYPLKTVSRTLEEIAENIQQHSAKVILLTQKNETAGFIHFSWKESRGAVDRLFVRESFRGNGFGKILMQCAQDCFTSHEVKSINIMVLADNQGAKEMYEKLGFKKRAEIMTRIFE